MFRIRLEAPSAHLRGLRADFCQKIIGWWQRCRKLSKNNGQQQRFLAFRVANRASANGNSGMRGGQKEPAKPRLKAHIACTADDLFLHLPHERDVWKKLTQAAGEEACSIVCDLSQSLGRNRERVDGKLPTICPGSKIIVGPLGRSLAPAETILLHGFPLHLMSIPEAI